MHVIYVNDGETEKEAEERYCAEKGLSIGSRDIRLFVIYVNYLQPDG